MNQTKIFLLLQKKTIFLSFRFQFLTFYLSFFCFISIGLFSHWDGTGAARTSGIMYFISFSNTHTHANTHTYIHTRTHTLFFSLLINPTLTLFFTLSPLSLFFSNVLLFPWNSINLVFRLSKRRRERDIFFSSNVSTEILNSDASKPGFDWL